MTSFIERPSRPRRISLWKVPLYWYMAFLLMCVVQAVVLVALKLNHDDTAKHAGLALCVIVPTVVVFWLRRRQG